MGKIFCFGGDSYSVGASNEGFRKIVRIVQQKKIGEYNCYLLNQFDKYEDGYRVVLAKDFVDSNRPYYREAEMLYDIYFSGSGEYGEPYATEYSGKTTFNCINSVEDFKNCEADKFFYVRENK